MENPRLIHAERQDNDTKHKTLPYFIEIKKAENKKLRIPCSNELVANKVLTSYSNYSSKSKVSLVGN